MKSWSHQVVGAGFALLVGLAAGPGAAASLVDTGEWARLQEARDKALLAYSRGEATLGERDEAARAFERASRVPAALLPPAPDSDLAVPQAPQPEAGVDAGSGSGSGQDEKPGAVAKIAAWVKDLPRRTFRRFAPEKEGIRSDAEVDHLVESSKVAAYTANAAQREAESDWTRPVMVTARAEGDQIQSVIERVVGVGGIAALAKALSGDAAARQTVSQAAKVVAKLTPEQRQMLAKNLGAGGIGQQISQFLKGQPTGAFQKIIKDEFGNNMLLAVAASGLVGAFLNDGLDLDTLKDHLVALNAVEFRRTGREAMIGAPLETILYYHMDRGVSRLFEGLWSRISTGSGGFAAWVQRTESTLTSFGSSIVKAPRPELAARAAEFSKSASSLGLPGVSSATALTFKGFSEAMFKAGVLGMVGIPLISGAWNVALGMEEGVYIGANRDRVFARYDLFHTYFQRTGNKWRDAWEERKVSVANLVQAYEKFPMTHFMSHFLRMAGGYLGAVVASSVVAPATIPTFLGALVVSAVFSEGANALGKWVGAKVDTSAGRYRRLRKKNAEEVLAGAMAADLDLPERQAALEALARVDALRARLGVRTRADLARVQSGGGAAAQELADAAAAYASAREAYVTRMATLADARADDYERLLKGSQVDSRIKFVRSLDDIRLVKTDSYVRVEIPGWSSHASPRHDFIDARGHRGVWDPVSNRVIDVGRVGEQNGNRIAFLNDDGVKVEGGALVLSPGGEKPTGSVHVTSNGIVMEKGATGEWLLRGYGGEYDIVLRGSGRRFAWDGKRFVETGTPAHVQAIAKQYAKDETATAYSRKLVQELGAGLSGRSAGKGEDPVAQAMMDLARLHKASGASAGQRFQQAVGGSGKG